MDIINLGPVPSVPYQKMYLTLFNAVTAALDLIEGNEIIQAQALLMRAQQETEEMYIAGGEEG